MQSQYGELPTVGLSHQIPLPLPVSFNSSAAAAAKPGSHPRPLVEAHLEALYHDRYDVGTVRT
jgi:hypothetical protein